MEEFLADLEEMKNEIESAKYISMQYVDILGRIEHLNNRIDGIERVYHRKIKDNYKYLMSHFELLEMLLAKED